MKKMAISLALLMSLPPAAAALDSGELCACMVRTEFYRSSSLSAHDYDHLRAQALVAAGHSEEALPFFDGAITEQEMEKAKGFTVINYYSLSAEAGQAYEAVGENEKALSCYKCGGLESTALPHAKLLIKMGRAAEAEEICSKALEFEKNSNFSQGNMTCSFLETRAEAEAALGKFQKSYNDFKIAALVYARSDSEKLALCLAKARRLTTGKNVGEIVIETKDFPAQGKSSIQKLLLYLTDSDSNFSAQDINSITGSSFVFKDDSYDNNDQEKFRPGYQNITYQGAEKSSPETCTFEASLNTDQCSFDRTAVLALMPEQKQTLKPIFDKYTGKALTGAEIWTFPKGALTLVFAASGFRVLQEIRWTGNDSEHQCGCGSSDSKAAEFARIKLIEQDYNAALRAANRAIKLGTKLLSSRTAMALSHHYILRADIYEARDKYDEAAADVTAAIGIAGNYYLPHLIDLLVVAGRREHAIDVLQKALLESKFQRERSLIHLLLAKLYFDEKRWQDSIDQSTLVIESEDKEGYRKIGSEPPYMTDYLSETERMSAPARVIKASAEAQLGKFDEARTDAVMATSQYYQIARIDCRDKIEAWIKRLPTH